MSQPNVSSQPGLDGFVRDVVQQYRTKLLDLTSRNPLISFRHSERSRSHIRVIEEIPEKVFAKLIAGKPLSFEPLRDPALVPPEENASIFLNMLRTAKDQDEVYKKSLSELGPHPSVRQKQRVERELRNRIRKELGLNPFEPTWEPVRRAKELGLNPSYDLPSTDVPPARRYDDSYVQTLFFSDDLERKLGGLREAARVLEKDAGLNALYCTFGYLDYYESSESEEKRVAPLVFVPITLERTLSEHQYTYHIKTRNEDVQTNVALAELLKNMAVGVPSWVDDDRNDNSLGSYLNHVETAIRGKSDWKVRRYVTIGLFTFSGLAMYTDLDPERWPPEMPLEQRPVVRTLIAGAEVKGNSQAEEYEVDNLQGPEPLLITDADSSQHSAVVDALRNKASQVIQGPPGTGKSQTITNIIAACLNEGLSVLFVAEKMAALDVVKKRLDAAGLEAFCFELHSSKTSKTVVAESLAQRIEFRPPHVRSELAQSNAEALSAAKKDLLYYVQRVNQSAGKTGMKIYDVLLGSAIRDTLRNALPPTLIDTRFANPLQISPHMYRQMLDAAETLECQVRSITTSASVAKHPWRGIQNIELTELDEGRLIALLSGWCDAIRELAKTAQKVFETVGCATPVAQAELEELCKQIVRTTTPPKSLVPQTFAACGTASNRAHLKRMLEDFSIIRDAEQRLASFTETGAAALGGINSESLDRVLHIWATFGHQYPTVGDLIHARPQQRAATVRLAHTEPFCSLISDATGLPDPRVGSLRAIVASVELLRRLPRDLWQKRLPSILDSGNRGALESARTRSLKISKARTELESRFDLQILPSAQDLRACGIALRSSSKLSSLFSADCRNARRVYRGISPNNSKASRAEMADWLLRCAQYVVDTETFANDGALRNICGPHYEGLDTPLAEILSVLTWGEDVRQRLAGFVEDGLTLREFLFTSTIEQLDQLLAFAQQPVFSLVSEILRDTTDSETKTWSDLVHEHRERSDCLILAADVFEGAKLRADCTQSDLATIRETIKELEASNHQIQQNAPGLSLAGGSLGELHRNANALALTLDFAETISSLPLPSELIAYYFADPRHISELEPLAHHVLALSSTVTARSEAVKRITELDPAMWCGIDRLERAPLQHLLARNEYALNNRSSLRDYIGFLLAEDAAVDQGLGPIISAYSAVGDDYQNVRRAVEFVFFRSAAEGVLNEDPRLRRHSGDTHAQLRSQFQSLDREYLELRRKQLATKLAGRSCPPGNSFGPISELTELALVTRIAGQTRPRITVRELIHRAGRALQVIKPCWMMSPPSVAQYLEPGKLNFDVVIIDEASQVPPQEALGAIARGSKAIIVGDQMQLPPTPFFQRLSAGSIGDDEDCEETKEDSVLEAAAGRFQAPRPLKWHYRSEHASLIAFSNHEFYSDQLTAFPSPFHEHPDYGVSLIQTNGVYDSGFNRLEADAVVKAATEFMENHPDLSLGIVAVNAKQKDFIREQIDRVTATNEKVAAYSQKWDPTLEPLFVKNLENVQGDERDVIYISTVYGKDAQGSFHQRFGPINGIYGHRRLNVLFTRAKKKVTVFTSMVPEEIQDESKHWGVKALKGYLQFARDGFAPMAISGGESESEFEQWVSEALLSHGYQAVRQLGICGYRIDIAVRNPMKLGTYLCGIECDGATYHSARSVRERDRLRQEILERYGWNLYRIWSTDWFRNPHAQTLKLIAHLERLQRSASA